MNNNIIILTVASYEDRFRLGMSQLVKELSPERLIMFFYAEYERATKQNLEFIISTCNDANVCVESYQISFSNPVSSWKTLHKVITALDFSEKELLVDISTMPRETIWVIFDLTEMSGATTKYVYHFPREYNDQWLSRDPGKPRLVFKLAGEVQLGMPTTLLILPGFDPDRTEQLMTFFEPKACLIGLQVGDQYGSHSRLINIHKSRFGKYKDIVLFDVDVYKDDCGFDQIEKTILNYIHNSNLIMSSLGPKLSAISLYKLHLKYPQTSLAYAPSNEFNINYSKGLATRTIGYLRTKCNITDQG